MKDIEKSKSIRAGLQKGFRNGTSKMAQRRCYGYDTGPDGELVINPDEAAAVRWIFDRYLKGDSLGKIAAGLAEQGILSPTGKLKWNREALNKLLSNEKYTGAGVAPEDYQRRRFQNQKRWLYGSVSLF